MENLGRDYVFLQFKVILHQFYSTPVLLFELGIDQEQVVAAAHVSSSAKLHGQRFSRAGQVAKSNL